MFGLGRRWIPETKGRSLEEMDIIFGAVSEESRAAGIEKQEKGACLLLYVFTHGT